MTIIDFAKQELSVNQIKVIRELDIRTIDNHHFGISMAIRNVIYKFDSKETINDQSLNVEYSIVDFFASGEINENYLLEKLWRDFNNINLTDNDLVALQKLVGDDYIKNLDKSEKSKMKIIKYLEKLKK